MAHREGVSGLLRTLSFEDKSLIDWGRGTKPVTNYIQATNCHYFGLDKLDHVGADLVADVASDQLSLLGPDGRRILFDVAFCMEVMEHVESPQVLLENVQRYLKRDGEFYFSVPFLYRIHSDQDYWRYTDQGLRLLLERQGFTVDFLRGTTDDNPEGPAGWVGKAYNRPF